MKYSLFLTVILLSLGSTSSLACDGTGLEERIKAVTSVDSQITDGLVSSVAELKGYLAGCSDFSGIDADSVNELKRVLNDGKQSLSDLKSVLLSGGEADGEVAPDERLQRLRVLESLQPVLDDALDKAGQVSVSLCGNYQPGTILSYSYEIYSVDATKSNTAAARLGDYIDSCISAASKPGFPLGQVTEELDKALAWVEQTQGLGQLESGSGAQGIDLGAVRNELARGVNLLGDVRYGWSDPFLTYFYAGYEGTTIDDVENEGNARVGLYIYNQFRSLHDRCTPFDPPSEKKNEIQRDCGWTFRVPHLYGNIFQSSSAEGSPDEDASDSTTVSGDFDAVVEPTMEVNIGAFWPFYLHPQSGHFDRKSVLAVGLVAEHGWRKTAGGEQFTQRAYHGFRLAFAPDSYLDVMRGTTDGRIGDRVELRGQYPVSDFSIGRLFLGGALNYDLDKVEKDTDSMRIYAIYHASFKEAFGGD